MFFEAQKLESLGIKSALVTVVDLDGSSYRRPGVRMLVGANGSLTGAVSGGCVEKEIQRQAQEVFTSGKALLMVYDGRYRLGCEGILYLLIEPITQASALAQEFDRDFMARNPIEMQSSYQKQAGLNPEMGTQITLSSGKQLSVGSKFTQATANSGLLAFKQALPPAIQLVIIGSEHDAVALCSNAAQIGMSVTIVAPPDDPKTLANFPGALAYLGISAEDLGQFKCDSRTAVLIMTHSFAKDLKYLGNLAEQETGYIGLLGPKKRREQLLNDLLEHYPETSLAFIESLYGPAGINIGAESAQEIAVSILAEILAVLRGQQPGSLKNKATGIHD